jgi:hypothetical protein
VWRAGANAWIAGTVTCFLLIASETPVRIVAPAAALYGFLSLFWWTFCAGRWVAVRYAAPRRTDGHEADYHDAGPPPDINQDRA